MRRILKRSLNTYLYKKEEFKKLNDIEKIEEYERLKHEFKKSVQENIQQKNIRERENFFRCEEEYEREKKAGLF
jgi:hypothetical protein